MKITIVYRYFWPDTAPYGLLLRELLPTLIEAGHEVSVMAGQPSYGADAAGKVAPSQSVEFGCTVRRFRLLPIDAFRYAKPLNMVLFSFIAFFRILFGPKADLYITGTTPPIIQSMLTMIAAKLRGARVLYHMQDIYPEIAIASDLMSDGFVTKSMRWLDTRLIKACDAVVVLSSDMANTIERRTGRAPSVINNFALGKSDTQRPKRQVAGKRLKYVFAGNLGNFQNLEKIVEVFGLMKNDNAELHFLGDGKAKRGLMELSRDLANVHFHDRLPVDKAFQFMQSCDVGVVSLKPDLVKYAYPTKTHSYFAAGLRVLALIEEESELASVLLANNAGLAIDSKRSVEEIASQIELHTKTWLSATDDFEPPREIWHCQTATQKWLTLLEGLK